MSEPLITVIMPTYNRRAMLKRAVNSVLQDKTAPLMLHIFDNASGDDTEDYVKDLMSRDPRVKYQRHPENLGSETNLREGLKSVSTKYFSILADDDWLLPGFLADALMILESVPDLGGAAFLAEARFESGELETMYPREKPIAGRREPSEHMRDFLQKGHYSWQSILWKSEVLSYVGYPYLHSGMASDVDFQAQIFSRYPIYVVDRPGAVYFRHEAQSALTFNIQHVFDWAKFFRRMDNKVAETNCLAKEEYFRLRRVALDRYKGAWRKNADTHPVTDKLETMKLYSAAAFSIGDMDLANFLINRMNTETAK